MDRFSEMPSNPLILSVDYLESIDQIYDSVDVAIIATNADIRRKVIEDLLSKIKVKYLIMEKIVFQNPNDFIPIKTMLIKKGIKSWINCPRRSYTFYQELKKKLVNKIIHIKVSGQNWGMACNSIHMVDLLAFLTGQIEMDFNVGDLYKRIYRSKRDGFLEIRGIMNVVTKGGDSLEIRDSSNIDGKNLVITISTGNVSYEIFEITNQLLHFKNGNVTENKINIPLQSENTGIVINNILTKGKCDLTSYEECMEYHVPMLKAFNLHFNSIVKNKIYSCPIT